MAAAVQAPSLRTFTGSCHCGALGFAFRTALPSAQWSVRACQCRFCRAHGAATTSDPAGRLTFRIDRSEALQRYRFGLETADFLVCNRCGVYVGAQIETASGAFGIINTSALTPIPKDLPAAVPGDYDSEGAGDRASRRERRWTPMERAI